MEEDGPGKMEYAVKMGNKKRAGNIFRCQYCTK
jgi:hypothetical protein